MQQNLAPAGAAPRGTTPSELLVTSPNVGIFGGGVAPKTAPVVDSSGDVAPTPPAAPHKKAVYTCRLCKQPKKGHRCTGCPGCGAMTVDECICNLDSEDDL